MTTDVQLLELPSIISDPNIEIKADAVSGGILRIPIMPREEVLRMPLGVTKDLVIELPNCTIVFEMEVVHIENDGVVVREKSEYYGSSGHNGSSVKDSCLVFYPRMTS